MEQSELLMNVSEVVDASGHAPPATELLRLDEGDAPKSENDSNLKKSDPKPLPKITFPPYEDDDSSSTTTLLRKKLPRVKKSPL